MNVVAVSVCSVVAANTSGCAGVNMNIEYKVRFSRNLLILHANDHETYYCT